MSSICLLIKPASSSCNLSCKYCFYKDVSTNRETTNKGIMSIETTEILIKNILNENYKVVNFAFQGGEPSLVGFNYFKKFIELVKKYNKTNIKILYSIQTNGYNLSEQLIKLFKENDFLVGISLDGPKEIHNCNRLSLDFKGSFSKVLKSINLLKKYNVEFNILSVLTSLNSKHIEKTYRFFKKQGFKYLQFIPCIDDFNYNKNNAISPFELTPNEYFLALNKLFKLYKDDFFNNNYISIRDFDNYIQILSNNPPESCSMSGTCGIYFVIESNGDVYPCDFYSIDKYKLGNIHSNNFSEFINSKELSNFILESKNISSKCTNCKYFKLCRGGCKRYRTTLDTNSIPFNKYCFSYYNFFENNIKDLLLITNNL